MKLLKPSPNLGKNDFDLSYRTLFSAKFGELLPAYVQETVPNDKIYIRPNNLIRAIPLVTSPFLRAKQHIDFWFVPYSALFSRFNEFMMDKSEPVSSALKGRSYIPSVALNYLIGTPEVMTGGYDVVGMDYTKGSMKLLDLLGYPTASNLYSVGTVSDDYRVNLFRLLAYNFIWYKEYRQQYYDDGLVNCSNTLKAKSSAPSFLWNLDFMQCTDASSSYFENESNFQDYLNAMCQMRYRLWKKDLFTGLMPSTQFGNVSIVNVGTTFPSGVNTSSDVNRWSEGYFTNLIKGSTPESIYGQAQGGTYEALSHTHTLQGISGNFSKFDILALRKSEAIQRWRENSLRAGNQIEDNWNAHYGVKNRSHMITHPTFIGSYDAPLNIGDIDATAQTGSGANQQLASVAGKGITSMDGRTFGFETSDFGVIIGMWSMLPEAEYNAAGINRMNSLLEREDFFFPEFENLGLAPVGGENFMAGTSSGSVQPNIGYAPRYWEYKQRFDEVHNQFMSFGSSGAIGDFAPWASPKYDVTDALYESASALPLSCLYVNPSLFDINFGASADTSDQFLVDFYFDVDAVRSMSVSGMPSY